jgi:hypothetical protein
MKTISNILFTMLASAGITLAQGGARPEVGFVRIVNAVAPGTGKAAFLINGRNLYPDGYELGQTTGGYGVKAGSLNIEVRKDGLESGRTNVRLAAGETVTVIAFAERVEPKKEGDPPQWVIKLLRLKQQDVERGYGVSLVSVCREVQTAVELVVEGRERPERAFAKRLNITTLELGRMRSEITLRTGGRVIGNISPDSPGNYVAILYENADGQVESISFYDPKFVIAG